MEYLNEYFDRELLAWNNLIPLSDNFNCVTSFHRSTDILL